MSTKPKTRLSLGQKFLIFCFSFFFGGMVIGGGGGLIGFILTFAGMCVLLYKMISSEGSTDQDTHYREERTTLSYVSDPRYSYLTTNMYHRKS